MDHLPVTNDLYTYHGLFAGHEQLDHRRLVSRRFSAHESAGNFETQVRAKPGGGKDTAIPQRVEDAGPRVLLRPHAGQRATQAGIPLMVVAGAEETQSKAPSKSVVQRIAEFILCHAVPPAAADFDVSLQRVVREVKTVRMVMMQQDSLPPERGTQVRRFWSAGVVVPTAMHVTVIPGKQHAAMRVGYGVVRFRFRMFRVLPTREHGEATRLIEELGVLPVMFPHGFTHRFDETMKVVLRERTEVELGPVAREVIQLVLFPVNVAGKAAVQVNVAEEEVEVVLLEPGPVFRTRPHDEERGIAIGVKAVRPWAKRLSRADAVQKPRQVLFVVVRLRLGCHPQSVSPRAGFTHEHAHVVRHDHRPAFGSVLANPNDTKTSRRRVHGGCVFLFLPEQQHGIRPGRKVGKSPGAGVTCSPWIQAVVDIKGGHVAP